jgi:hypothetical protein
MKKLDQAWEDRAELSIKATGLQPQLVSGHQKSKDTKSEPEGAEQILELISRQVGLLLSQLAESGAPIASGGRANEVL